MISFEEILSNKQASGQHKDLADVEQLHILQELQTLQNNWRQEGMTEQAIKEHSEQWIHEQQIP